MTAKLVRATADGRADRCNMLRIDPQRRRRSRIGPVLYLSARERRSSSADSDESSLDKGRRRISRIGRIRRRRSRRSR